MSERYGVVVGRFQVDDLHAGHKYLLDKANRNHDQLIVVLGTSRSPANATNPLDVPMRMALFRTPYPRAIILTIQDERSHEAWSKKLDGLIRSVIGFESARLYASRDSFVPFYSGSFPVEEVEAKYPELSATTVRENIARRPTTLNKAFRQGVIYAHQTRAHQTYETVDVAFFRNIAGVWNILLGKKPGEEKWRLPGGFIDPGETSRQAAARELREETGLTSEGGFRIIGDHLIDDWRLRGNKGVSHRTFLCIGYYFAGAARASDDLESVEWFKFEALKMDNWCRIMDEHQLLLQDVADYIEAYGHPNP